MRVILSVVFVLFLTILIVPAASSQQAKPGAAAVVFSDVAPVFQSMCVKCHSGERPAYGLRLDSYKNLMAGGKHGAVLTPGNPKQSEIVKRVKGEKKPRMPKNGPPWVSDKDTALLEKWIADGARE